MIYNKFCDKEISMLGMGCMRFPVLDNGEVDFLKTEELIDLCIKEGVNYFDTAWFYHGGKSEETMGKILKKYKRESFYLATKMPGNDFKSKDEVIALFEKQLKDCQVEYFDFYLFHNVCEDNINIFTDENLGIIDYLKEQKEKGRIKHLGFSTHGSLKLIEEFIKDNRDIIEFCQIQLNWLDWTLQDAKAKVELLQKYNLPIWVMEPVRGGRLAKLSDEDEKNLKDLRPEESVPAWAFRFIQSIPDVKMVLSGMSDKNQLEDNLKTFSENKPLTDKERNIIFKIADKILSKKTLACTDCKYCIEECPKKIEIPKILSLYNNMCLIKKEPDYNTVKEKTNILPSECIGCKACEKKCPQGIKISEIMKDFSEQLNC